MTKQTAINHMLKGELITHTYFDPSEWMTMPNKTEIKFEDGRVMNVRDFWFDRKGEGWDSGYSIWKPVMQ